MERPSERRCRRQVMSAVNETPADVSRRAQLAGRVLWTVGWLLSLGWAVGLLLLSLRQPAGVITLSSALVAGLVIGPVGLLIHRVCRSLRRS